MPEDVRYELECQEARFKQKTVAQFVHALESINLSHLKVGFSKIKHPPMSKRQKLLSVLAKFKFSN